MSLRIVTPPTSEPVTLAEVRMHVRIDSTADDALLASLVIAAREMVEHELQRSLIARTYELTLDEFPDSTIELPMGPIAASGGLSVSSVIYTDTLGSTQTVSSADYLVDGYSDVPRLTPVSGWPTAQVVQNAVRVVYTSGHANASLIPAAIKTWIELHAAHFYENREAAAGASLTALPFLGRLLDPYRTFR
jgi:uncharacterized phiE125 gp8 family phage protein